VPFNQRLLSSTPAGTPKRKRLVERQGVLLLNGSTETQILNSTGAAAAVRPPSPPRPFGPCLSRGDVQFAAAVHLSSSSSSIPSSTGSCEVEAAPLSGATAHPLYSLASSHSVPHRGTSAPCYSTVPSSAWQPPASSQPAIYTAAGNSRHPVTTSLAHGVDHNRQSGLPVPPAAGSGGAYGKSPTSVRFSDPQATMDHFHLPVRPLQGRIHPSAPCSCNQLAFPTDVTSTAFASDPSRFPETLAASSSQETIEIRLEPSPRRSKAHEQFTVVRGTTAERNCRRHSRSSTLRDRRTSDNAGRRARCRSTAEDSDTERLTSLLRQLKAVVTANRNPEVARLLSEVCEAARSLPVLPAQPPQPVVDDSLPVVEQLRSEVTQLNRLEYACFDPVIFKPPPPVGAGGSLRRR